jgi:Tol biopolymer transport system component
VSLPAGSRVGPYEIIASIGAGGMGEVYRARDLKLGRDVAIKVLPDSVSKDVDRLARFEREARSLASLNHPNIAQIYGFEDGALVMELLEGDTLRDRLRDGALPVRKAIEYGAQIARGLAAAHDRGIIHRDLKPENIFLLKDGQVKLLDFGLARNVAPASSGVTETLAKAGGTDPGTVLGTVGYMSPEQVRAEAIDARSDLFSLGAVLYEMLSGERAFRRHTNAETMTAILREDPADLSARAEISPAIDRIVRHALEKNPVERVQTARDVAFALDALSGSASASVPARTERPRLTRERAAWVAVTLALAALAIWLQTRPLPVTTVEQPYQLTVALPDDIRSNEFVAPSLRMALSHDGTNLAYAGVDPSGAPHLWIISLRNGSIRELAGAAGGSAPAWSPDGSQITYSMRQGRGYITRQIAVAGGSPETLATDGVWKTWSPGGVLLLSGPGRGLRWIDPATGAVHESNVEANVLRGASFLPDGRRYLVGELTSTFTQVATYVASLDSTARTKLIEGSALAVYSRGAVAYARGTTLVAQRFDERNVALVGQPVTLTEGVDYLATSGYAVAASPVGTLVVQRPERAARSQLQWLRRDGTVLSTVGEPADYSNTELSPDGRRLLVTSTDPAVRTRDVFIVDLGRGVRQRATFDPSDERSAVWSADGRHIYYRSKGNELYVRRSDLTDEPQILLADGVSKDPYAASRDGQYLVYRASSKKGDNNVMLMPLGKGGPPIVVRATDFDEIGGSFSPDGRSVVYNSDESGQMEVYVAATDGSGARVQLSQGGAREARWVRNGKEIFYYAPANRTLMSVPVKGSGATFQAGVPRPLFRIDVPQNAGIPYDVAADGERILAIRSIDGTPKPVLTAIINWPALLEK